ncbi:hypothetical protein Cri9333_3310 [Crinalium epipsammum PCC 9333]|uniref:Uncharacterized protein n=1 Tax=Crinalium epipsammum PCC 9333 TaxID=1173022 RepID=K9W1R3_9CYAN|nr:hypothetical protein [Crinalium epipsammum]AFZ14141.1 hypothetical protein Cri9333_3310 [Crinalium epipsammum PCC 9333]
MLEVIIGSVLVGSLGLQTLSVSGWLYWRQQTIRKQNEWEEEEDILTSFESKEELAIVHQPLEIQNNSSAIEPAKNPDPRLMGWEFKIVRAKRDLFRDPRIFQQLCEEERSAGWILLEKLDDRRARFKRPIALREIVNPEFLSFDPYRSYYGPTWTTINWLGTLAAILTLIAPAYLGYTYVSRGFARSQERPPDPPAQQLPPPEKPPAF